MLGSFLFSLFIIYISNITKYDTPYKLVAIKTITSKSRFGDCLSIIFISNFLSLKYKIPIIYENFCYSDQLVIQDLINDHKILNNKHEMRKFKHKRVKNIDEICLRCEDTIFEVNIQFYDKYISSIKNLNCAKEQLRKIIIPKNELKMPCFLSKNNINLAVHVRKGTGFDLPLLSEDGLSTKGYNFGKTNTIDASELANKYKKTKFFYSDLRWPYKFPPDSFYVDQIKRICRMFPNKKIHVHIFTDHDKPENIVEKYSNNLRDPNINFSCRQKDNHHNKNILEDFFAMTKFDYLIRPISSYSQNAELIGNFKLTVTPKHGIWIKDLLIIDEISDYP